MKPNKCHHKDYLRIDGELGTKYKCKICGQEFTSVKRKLTNLWIKQRFYQGRGATYTGQLVGIYNTIQTGGILYLILWGSTGKAAPLWILLGIWLVQTIFETWVGRKDYKKWKLAQRESVLSSSFAPLAIEMLNRLKNVEKMVNPKDYNLNSVLDEYKK